MKQILLITFALLTFALSGCDKKSDIKSNDSPIYIKGKDMVSTNKAAFEGKMTVEEIFNAVGDSVKIDLHADLAPEEGHPCYFDKFFNDNHQNLDRQNHRLIMEAANVIWNDRMSELGGMFLQGRNYTVSLAYEDASGLHYPIVGYIPNDVIRQAQVEILDLWKEGKIAEIYKRFQDTFYFTPCTEEEWHEKYEEDIDWEHEYDFLLPEHEHTHEITW